MFRRMELRGQTYDPDSRRSRACTRRKARGVKEGFHSLELGREEGVGCAR